MCRTKILQYLEQNLSLQNYFQAFTSHTQIESLQQTFFPAQNINSVDNDATRALKCLAGDIHVIIKIYNKCDAIVLIAQQNDYAMLC